MTEVYVFHGRVGISALMLDTGYLILDKRNYFMRVIQHPASSIQLP